MSENVKRQAVIFAEFCALGWDTETAFECCYDQVYDEISKAKFLDVCMALVKQLKEGGAKC